MSIAMLLKIFSDCCLCFAIVGSGALQHDYSLLIPALICALSAALATFCEEKGWTAVRKFCALLPLSSLLLAGEPSQMTVLIFPLGYTMLVILRGRLELEYYSFRHSFLKSLTLVAAVYVVAGACSVILNGNERVTTTIDPDMVLRFGLMHLLCGITLQRQLRLGLGRRAAGGGRQLASVLMAVLVISVAFVAVEPLLFQGLANSFNTLLSVAMMPLMYAAEGATKIVLKMEQTIAQAKPPVNDTDASNVAGGAFGNGGVVQDTTPVPEPATNTDYIWLLIAGLFAVAAVAILLYSYKKQQQQMALEQQVGFVDGRPKKKKAPASSARTRVRQIYREFLKTEKTRGMRLKISDTSASVLARISPRTDEAGAVKLRQIYLSARYDDRNQIDKSQVEQARQALKASHQKQGGQICQTE